MEIGIPTFLDRPQTTAFFPNISMPLIHNLALAMLYGNLKAGKSNFIYEK